VQNNLIEYECHLKNGHSEKTVHVHYINWLVLFREIISVYFENHQNRVNTVHGQNTEVFIVIVSSMYNNHCPEIDLIGNQKVWWMLEISSVDPE
jgi:hypothetical protein